MTSHADHPVENAMPDRDENGRRCQFEIGNGRPRQRWRYQKNKRRPQPGAAEIFVSLFSPHSLLEQGGPVAPWAPKPGSGFDSAQATPRQLGSVVLFLFSL